MTVFKAYFKILYKYKFIVLLYTGLLILFSGFNTKNTEMNLAFQAEKADIYIVNEDDGGTFSQGLIDYLAQNANIKKVSPDSLDDALFYRELNYILYIPKNYSKDFISGKNPALNYQTTGDYNGSLVQMQVENYLKVAKSLNNDVREDDLTKNLNNDVREDDLTKNVKAILDKKADVKIASQVNLSKVTPLVNYYNFANYVFIAGLVYVICLAIFSFRKKTIHKRITVSSLDYKKFNAHLLFSSGIFAFIFWIFYFLLSIMLFGNIVFTSHGLIILLNSFIFIFVILTLAFLIANLISSKDALSGIINVVALGSSFLCGSFVPMSWLPKSVLNMAHILPSYWYIKNNELVLNLESFSIKSLLPIIKNWGVILLFSLFFIIISNLLTKRKRKIN